MDASNFFECLFEKCEAKLPTVKSLISHMRLVHHSEKDCHLVCHINKCEKNFSTSDSYRKHVEREHRLEWENSELQQWSQIKDAPVCNNAEAMCSDNMDVCDDKEYDFTEVIQHLQRNVAMFALTTRETRLLPKSTCNSIMSDVSSLFSIFFQSLSEFVIYRLEKNGFDLGKDPALQQVLFDHSVVQSVWCNVQSDSKLKRFCKEKLGLIEAETVLLGLNENTGKPECYQFVPVCRTLQKYIQHEDVWNSMNRITCKAQDVLYDYTDGTAFKQHNFFSMHPHALRIHLNLDDLELCNPLGSARKKHSITAVYYQLGNIEQKHLSALKSVHVACIAKTVHVKKYGLHKILEKFIEDVKKLESEGIEIMIDGKVHTLLGSLATVSADNLASNDIGGFRKCFSSGRICRFCMVCYDRIAEFSSETNDNYPKLRTVKEHDMHVSSVVADDSLAAVYGVNKEAALGALDSFHAVTSLPPDCMHDVLEGVIPIVLKVCLQGLINQKVLTVQAFNERLERFKFGQNDVKNVPVKLSATFPKSGLSGSAAQNWCLFRILSVLIGDLVPAGNQCWELYIYCRKMTEIIFAPSVTKSQIAYLDSLIMHHHQLLVEIAPQHFTPKCHFVTHYPRLVSVFGPLRHHWCMRFESYHQYLKSISQSTGNFKNICYTLAERNQLRKCLEMSDDHCLLKEEYVIVHQIKISILSLHKSLHMPVAKYFGCSLNCQVVSVNSAVVDGVHYAVDDCFILDVVDGDVPVFFRISHILAFDSIWCLCGNLAFCTKFLSHYHAYAIENDAEWLVLRPGTELSYHALDVYKIRVDAAEFDVVVLRHTVPS